MIMIMTKFRVKTEGFLSDNFYFDSFGVQPPKELTEYLISPIYYNTERIQPDGEVVCGHLCLYTCSADYHEVKDFRKS